MEKIGVIGAGSWGTALAQTIAGKGYDVHIYDVNREHLDEMNKNRENVRYLPGVPFSDNIKIAYTAEEALDGAMMALILSTFAVFQKRSRKTLCRILQAK